MHKLDESEHYGIKHLKKRTPDIILDHYALEQTAACKKIGLQAVHCPSLDFSIAKDFDLPWNIFTPSTP